MRPKAELQTHVHSWCVGQTVEAVRVHAGTGNLMFNLSGGRVLRVAGAGREALSGGVFQAGQQILSVRIHEGAGTLLILFGEGRTILSSVIFFLKVAQPQPVKVFKDGKDVTGEFDESQWEDDKDSTRRAGTAYKHTWSAEGGFKTEPVTPTYDETRAAEDAIKRDIASADAEILAAILGVNKQDGEIIVGIDPGGPDGYTTEVTMKKVWDEGRKEFIYYIIDEKVRYDGPK